jgi:hypothetical protein
LGLWKEELRSGLAEIYEKARNEFTYKPGVTVVTQDDLNYMKSKFPTKVLSDILVLKRKNEWNFKANLVEVKEHDGSPVLTEEDISIMDGIFNALKSDRDGALNCGFDVPQKDLSINGFAALNLLIKLLGAKVEIANLEVVEDGLHFTFKESRKSGGETSSLISKVSHLTVSSDSDEKSHWVGPSFLQFSLNNRESARETLQTFTSEMRGSLKLEDGEIEHFRSFFNAVAKTRTFPRRYGKFPLSLREFALLPLVGGKFNLIVCNVEYGPNNSRIVTLNRRYRN